MIQQKNKLDRSVFSTLFFHSVTLTSSKPLNVSWPLFLTNKRKGLRILLSKLYFSSIQFYLPASELMAYLWRTYFLITLLLSFQRYYYQYCTKVGKTDTEEKIILLPPRNNTNNIIAIFPSNFYMVHKILHMFSLYIFFSV